MDTNERWVTVREASALLGKSDRTIRRWVADGKLAADRTGAALLVDIARHVPSEAAATPSMPSDADALLAEIERLREALAERLAELDGLRAKLADTRAEIDALQADRDRLRDILAEVRAARDYLEQALNREQALAMSLSSQRLALGEKAGERPRRRFRWPWQRRDG